MIKYVDFAVLITEPATVFNKPEFEPIEETLLRMNAWIEKYEISVLNVETLFIPNMHEGVSQNKTEDSYYETTSGGHKNKWFQIFRVWYHGESKCFN